MKQKKSSSSLTAIEERVAKSQSIEPSPTVDALTTPAPKKWLGSSELMSIAVQFNAAEANPPELARLREAYPNFAQQQLIIQTLDDFDLPPLPFKTEISSDLVPETDERTLLFRAMYAIMHHDTVFQLLKLNDEIQLTTGFGKRDCQIVQWESLLISSLAVLRNELAPIRARHTARMLAGAVYQYLVVPEDSVLLHLAILIGMLIQTEAEETLELQALKNARIREGNRLGGRRRSDPTKWESRFDKLMAIKKRLNDSGVRFALFSACYELAESEIKRLDKEPFEKYQARVVTRQRSLYTAMRKRHPDLIDRKIK